MGFWKTRPWAKYLQGLPQFPNFRAQNNSLESLFKMMIPVPHSSLPHQILIWKIWSGDLIFCILSNQHWKSKDHTLRSINLPWKCLWPETSGFFSTSCCQVCVEVGGGWPQSDWPICQHDFWGRCSSLHFNSSAMAWGRFSHRLRLPRQVRQGENGGVTYWSPCPFNI